ncbi:MAG: aldo/keto reductase [Planctomycetes bacterium]|nr:aldo/keto reductase [Planctomycetota bacterium]
MPALPTRPLGRTGFDVSLFALGGVTYNTLGDAEAAAVVHRALDLGVNYIDTAHSYKESERKLGPVIAERRDEVFLATKSTARDAGGMAAELEESFRRLRTDRLDLVQIHDLHTLEQVAQITAPGGALEAIERFRAEGRVRFVGVTGHRYPSVLARALEAYPFDTILVALGAVHGAVRDFYRAIHPVAVKRGVGILGMKVMAYGFLKDHATDAMRYVLSLPDVSAAVIGVDTLAQVEANARAAAAFQPLDEAGMQAILAAARGIYEQRKDQAWFIRLDGQ